ncbi:MAG: N-acetylglucosaminyl-diphospho-decaprenol L-rhamnosyltransferase, partial [uncultured Frankineae bacterium]
ERDAPAGRRRHLLARLVAGRVPALAAHRHERAVRRRARRQRQRRRRTGGRGGAGCAAAADRRQRRLRPRREPRGLRSRRAVAGRGQSRRRLDAGSARRAARRRTALAARRLPRTGDPHPRRPALPLGPRLPVAGPGHRARGLRLVVAGQPVDPVLPRRARIAGRGHDRLAVRLLHAAAARGVRGGRRLRPGLLHVLRGHGPVPPAGRGGLGERLRPLRGRHPPGRPRHLPVGGRDAARAPPRAVPLPVPPVRRPGPRAPARAAGPGTAPALPARGPGARRRGGRRPDPLGGRAGLAFV